MNSSKKNPGLYWLKGTDQAYFIYCQLWQVMAVVKAVVYVQGNISTVQFYEIAGEQKSSCAWGNVLDVRKVGVRKVLFD